jgi:hypothetical protein
MPNTVKTKAQNTTKVVSNANESKTINLGTATANNFLNILSPSESLENGSYEATIIGNELSYSKVFEVGANKAKTQIAFIKCAIEGGKPFNVTILSMQPKDFVAKYKQGQNIDIDISQRASKNDANVLYKQAQF